MSAAGPGLYHAVVQDGFQAAALQAAADRLTAAVIRKRVDYWPRKSSESTANKVSDSYARLDADV